MARGKALVALDLPDPSIIDEVLAAAMEPFEDDSEDDAPDDGNQRIWESYELAGTLATYEPDDRDKAHAQQAGQTAAHDKNGDPKLHLMILAATAVITPAGEWINRATWDGPRPDFDTLACASLADHPAAQIAIVTYRT